MFPVSDVIPSRTTPFVTIGLIVANTLTFIYQLQLDRQQMSDLAHAFGAVPVDLAWPTLVTSLFMHDGWIHFGGNMLYLWIFGDNVEDSMGHVVYLLFYLIAGGLGVLAQIGLQPSSITPLIGASSAVAAIIGAYLVLYRGSQVLTAVILIVYLDVIEVPVIFFVGAWFLVQLLGGFASMGAPLTGFALGSAAGLVTLRRRNWWK